MTALEPGREEAEPEAEVVAVAEDRVSEEKREAEVVAVAMKKRGREAEAEAEESSKKLKIGQDKVTEYGRPRTIPPMMHYNLWDKPRASTQFPFASIMHKRINTHVGTPNWGDHPSPEVRKLMEAALKSYNDECARRVKAKPEVYQWVEYDFGGGLHINAFVDDGIWCHLNFRAKIKVDTSQSSRRNNGPILIFAELKRTHGQEEYEVVTSQNLGPAEFVHVPRLKGCRACDIAPHRDVLLHGRKGFNVGVTPEFR